MRDHLHARGERRARRASYCGADQVAVPRKFGHRRLADEPRGAGYQDPGQCRHPLKRRLVWAMLVWTMLVCATGTT